MQQIERYGVIALVFLLVTIVAVSFWGDSKSPGFWSRLTGKSKKEEVAKVEPPSVTSEQAITGGAPLSAVPPAGNVPPSPLDAQTQPGTPPGSQPLAPIGGMHDVAFAAGGQPGAGTQPVTPIGGSQAAPLGSIVQPPAPVDSAPVAKEYTVQKGDSLALISRRTLGSEQRWSEIQTLNPGVTPKNLRIGMKLKLPEGATAEAQPKAPESASKVATKGAAPKPAAKVASAVAPAAKKAETKGTSKYTIQRGDTLNTIAEQRLGGKAHVKEILALNPGLDPKRLTVGKSIQLPSAAKTERAPLVAAAFDSSSNAGRPRVR